MNPMSAKEFINNIIAKSEPYIVDDADNIDLFITDKEGNLLSISPTHKIVINDISYYYTLTVNNWIYLYKSQIFDNIFAEDNSNLYDWYGDHFSFGYNYEFPNILNFHLTNYSYDNITQNTHREAIYCDFKLEDFITSNKNPQCTARKSKYYLQTSFDNVFSNDVSYIKDIITFGLTQDKIVVNDDEHLYHGKVYKIQTGPKGGLFILVPQNDETGEVSEKKIRITKSKINIQSVSQMKPLPAPAPTPPQQPAPAPTQQPAPAPPQTSKSSSSSKTDLANLINDTNQLTINGGGSYTYKFQKLIPQFVLKFAKNNDIILNNNTYIFIKKSTNHMAILFNYNMAPNSLVNKLPKNTKNNKDKQYILHANIHMINKYMSPGTNNKNIFKNTSLVYV